MLVTTQQLVNHQSSRMFRNVDENDAMFLKVCRVLFIVGFIIILSFCDYDALVFK